MGAFCGFKPKTKSQEVAEMSEQEAMNFLARMPGGAHDDNAIDRDAEWLKT